MEKNKRIIILIAAAIIILIVVVLIGSGQSNTTTKQTGGLKGVTVASPLTKSTDLLTVDPGSTADLNTAAVRTEYPLFGLGTLPFSAAIKLRLSNTLPDYLREFIQPAFKRSYIHIVKDSVKQSGAENYSFDFYVDDPETYFHYSHSDSAGSAIGNPLTQIPWEGIK